MYALYDVLGQRRSHVDGVRVLTVIVGGCGLATRVRHAVLDLNYRPNAVARSLRRQRTNLWCSDHLRHRNPSSPAGRGVEDVAQEVGYSVVSATATRIRTGPAT